MGMIRHAAALTTVLTLLGVLGPAGGALPAAATGCMDPFTPALRSTIATEHPGQRVTAAVHDTRTGCWYHLGPDEVMETASVVKAQFLAGVLLRAQDQARGMSPWEQQRVDPMMRVSHNPPASDLFTSLGGVTGLERLDERLGLTATGHTSTWGRTTTTATDRTRLALTLLHGGGPLEAAARAEAWWVMSSVHPTQQWGISAGAPAGWSVALKNGFYPASGTPRWRIGSTGFVRHDATGEGYAVTIMTDRNPDHASGQDLVELVSRAVAGALTEGPAAPRAVDRSRCVAAGGGESWSQVAARLGTPDAAGVRHVSGGPARPLAGMRACRPDVAAPVDTTGPTARYVRAAFAVFLDRAPSPAELEHHVRALETGAADRAGHAGSLARSDEWTGRTIDELYRAALGRPADSGGLAHWSDQVRRRLPLAEVAVHLHASEEAWFRAGGTPEDFVAHLYREVLHREPDDDGARHWTTRLLSGTAYGEVVRGFLGSPEWRRQRVQATYRAVLARDADAAGLRYWTEQVAGLDEVALAASLAAGDEFFEAAQR